MKKLAANMSVTSAPIKGFSGGDGKYVHWTMSLFWNPGPKKRGCIQLSAMELSSNRPFPNVSLCVRDAYKTARALGIGINQTWIPAELAFPCDPKKGLRKGKRK